MAPFRFSSTISADREFKDSSEPRRESQFTVASVIDVRVDIEVEDTDGLFQVDEDAGEDGTKVDSLEGGRPGTRSKAWL